MKARDPNIAFILKVRLRTDEPAIVIVAYDDMVPNWDSAGRQRLTVEVRQGGKVIFPKGQLYGAHHGSSDGVAAREHVMSLVAMKPGDTDDEYFTDAQYTPEQLEWAEHNGDGLSYEREYRYCDTNSGACARDWAHLTRIKRARQKECDQEVAAEEGIV